MHRLSRVLAIWLVTCGGAGITVAANAPEFLRWRRYEEPAFPPELYTTTVRDGFATVVFTFDDEGRITDRLVLASSHPAFTRSVLTAILHWEVDATGLAASLRRESVRFDFERSGSIVSLSQRDASKASFSAFGDQVATSLRTFREDAIDSPLKVLARVAPEYPPALKIGNVEGHATISFVIDGEGRVRVPIVSDAREPEFGTAALVALRQWRFAPARRSGHIVQVIAERTVSFRLSRATNTPVNKNR